MDTRKMTLKESLELLRSDIDTTVKRLRSEGRIEKGGREIALVITKLQEARLWAGEALKEMGHYD